MDDVTVNVNHDRHRHRRPGADQEVTAGDDSAWFPGLVDEAPGEAGLVHTVQVDAQIDVIHRQAPYVPWYGLRHR